MEVGQVTEQEEPGLQKASTDRRSPLVHNVGLGRLRYSTLPVRTSDAGVVTALCSMDVWWYKLSDSYESGFTGQECSAGRGGRPENRIDAELMTVPSK